MATFKALVHEHQERDGVFNVNIRIIHKRKPAYIKTKHFVHKGQLTTKRVVHKGQIVKSLEIKDNFILKKTTLIIEGYQKIIDDMGSQYDTFTARQLADYLIAMSDTSKSKIDFIKEAYLHIKTITKKRYRDSFNTTMNHFLDYIKDDNIDIKQVTGSLLQGFDRFLRTTRKGTRNGRKGTKVEYTFNPLPDDTVHHYMSDIRTLFNEVKKQYNSEDEEEAVITHYPFAKYEIPQVSPTKKRNLKADVILKILNLPDKNYNKNHGTDRTILARDMFMLSFYLVGINSVDLYNIDTYEEGRLTYNRTKTESRRKDQAEISIKVEPEVIPLINKYLDPTKERVFIFHKMYCDEQSFNKAINKGLKKVSSILDLAITLTFYYARHSWATIARNICKISKDDIGECLNHSSGNHDVTDIYIERDWSMIDNANRKVLDVLVTITIELILKLEETDVVA